MADIINTRLLRSELSLKERWPSTSPNLSGFRYCADESIDLTLINPPETDAEGIPILSHLPVLRLTRL